MLLATLKDKGDDTRARSLAAEALGKLQAEEAIPILVTIVGQRGEHQHMSDDTSMRSHAAEALGLMGSKAGSAVPVLEWTSQDQYDKVGTAATKALEKIRRRHPVIAESR